jgi:hypothetical protein
MVNTVANTILGSQNSQEPNERACPAHGCNDTPMEKLDTVPSSSLETSSIDKTRVTLAYPEIASEATKERREMTAAILSQI